MLRWIRYKLALYRAQANKNRRISELSDAIAEQKNEFSKWKKDQEDAGTSILDAGYMGGEGRFERKIMQLSAELEGVQRDYVELHTKYYNDLLADLGLNEVDKTDKSMRMSNPYWGTIYRNGEPVTDVRELLSPAGIHYARTAIRKEKKERFEPWKDRMGLIFGAGGFVVAALALSLRMMEVLAARPAAAPPQPTACSPSAPAAVGNTVSPPALPSNPAPQSTPEPSNSTTRP